MLPSCSRVVGLTRGVPCGVSGAGYRTASSIKAANDQLQHFVELLEGEGVVVRRPEELDFNVSVKTPDFEVPRMNTSGADILRACGDFCLLVPA